ncbi:hypothetical protein ABK040_011168 [Willaertia magna]
MHSDYVDNTLSDLCEEHPNILINIFDYLDIFNLIQNIFYVCRTWNKLLLTEHFQHLFKKQYLLENNSFVIPKMTFDSETSNPFNIKDESKMGLQNKTKRNKVSFEETHKDELEGKEIIPSFLSYNRNQKEKFLFDSKDTVERYGLFVRYCCLERAREALSQKFISLLDEYIHPFNYLPKTTNQDKKIDEGLLFRELIHYDEIEDKSKLVNFFMEQAQKWFLTLDCRFIISEQMSIEEDSIREKTERLIEIWDLSKDVITYSGMFANIVYVDVTVRKKGAVTVQIDIVSDELDKMDYENDLSFVEENKFL